MATTSSFTVGSIECRIVSDGSAHYPREQIFPNVPAAEIAPLLEGRTDEQGNVPLGLNCLMVRSGGKTALIDTGLGELAKVFGAPAGRMRQALLAAGVRPFEVNLVIVSHAHPDHISGLTAEGQAGTRTPVFPKARHYFSKTEWEFWTSEAGLAQVPDVMRGPARTHLPPLGAAKVVETVDGEREVLPGVRLLPAPGHTPGHMAVSFTSGRDGAMYIADAVVHELNFEHPEWLSIFDAIPALTIETRRRLIEQAIREDRLVVGYHLATPVRLERSGTAYRSREAQPVAG